MSMSVFFALLDSVWQYAVFISKYVFLVLLFWSLYTCSSTRPLTVLHQAFVRELVKKGEYIVFGTVIAGLLLHMTGSTLLATVAFAILFGLSLYFTQPEPQLGLSRFKELFLSGIVVIACILMLLAIVLQFTLVSHVVTVFLYAVLFWQV